jgi:hypothetical protein
MRTGSVVSGGVTSGTGVGAGASVAGAGAGLFSTASTISLGGSSRLTGASADAEDSGSSSTVTGLGTVGLACSFVVTRILSLDFALAAR